jgi:hypothetical protein
MREMGGTLRLRGKAIWLAPFVFFLLSFPSPSRAQFWNKKDYRQWSAKECQKILSDSPWAKNRSFSSVHIPNGGQDTEAAAVPYGVASADSAAAPGRQTLVEIKYTAQFFSALPVREAQVRLAQIQSHYDRMTPAQKRAFDASAARFLAVSFPEETVIRVIYSTNLDSYRTQLETTWSLENTAKLQHSSYITVDGRIFSLRRYKFGSAQDQAFFLFFPRKASNEPLLNSNNKSVTLQVTKSTLPFTNDFGSDNALAPPQPPPAGNVEFEFNVKKMIFRGKVAY